MNNTPTKVPMKTIPPLNRVTCHQTTIASNGTSLRQPQKLKFQQNLTTLRKVKVKFHAHSSFYSKRTKNWRCLIATCCTKTKIYAKSCNSATRRLGRNKQIFWWCTAPSLIRRIRRSRSQRAKLMNCMTHRTGQQRRKNHHQVKTHSRMSKSYMKLQLRCKLQMRW